MNPDSNSNLPQPVSEPRPTPSVDPGQTVSSMPSPQAQPDSGGGFSHAAPVPVPPPLTAADGSAQALQQLQSGATDAVTQTEPVADEDNVVLDKEWIDKAKQIVANNQADPYEQNRRLAEIKADYLLKRYAKTIKLAD